MMMIMAAKMLTTMLRDRIWCNKHLRHTATEKYDNGKVQLRNMHVSLIKRDDDLGKFLILELKFITP